MSIKKALLLAASALAAIAFAAPATASAEPGQIVDVDGPLPEHVEEGVLLHGQFETLGSGIGCTVHATLTTENGLTNTTRIVDPEITTNTCQYFGLYEPCVLEDDEFTEDPYVVHPDANTPGDSLTVTDVVISGTFEPDTGCPFHTTDLYFPHIEIAVDDPITTGTLTEPDPETGTNEGIASGTLADNEPFELPVAATGDVTVENPGTYSIE